jgi:hypothetical protein
MSEHAFDPMPDEEQEEAPSIATGITDGGPIVVGGSVVFTAPNATVTVKQLRAAVESGRWTHDEPGTALWLNTSFSPKGREPSELIAELAAHGVVCS